MNQATPHDHPLLISNRKILAQLTDMLQRIDATIYSHSADSKNSTIGAHTRHIIEFYQEFMPLLSDGDRAALCYDNRKRDLLIERSKDKAVETLALIDTQLTQTSLTSRDITLTCITVPDLPPSDISSNLERELMFLLDHALHHMAIIKMLAEQQDITFDDSFGVAGATLVYQKQSA